MAGQSVFLSRGQSALSVLRCLADLLPGQFRCKCISAGSTGLSNSCQVPLKILTPASLLNYLFLLTVCKLLLMWVELLITQQGGSQSGEKSQQFIWLWVGTVSDATLRRLPVSWMDSPRFALVSSAFLGFLGFGWQWPKLCETNSGMHWGKYL